MRLRDNLNFFEFARNRVEVMMQIGGGRMKFGEGKGGEKFVCPLAQPYLRNYSVCFDISMAFSRSSSTSSSIECVSIGWAAEEGE